MNPLTRRAERWADEARRLGRIARNEPPPPRCDCAKCQLERLIASCKGEVRA